MNIIEYKSVSDPYDIKSVNEVIHVVGGNTPELILEDGSYLIFGSFGLYTEITRMPKYFNIKENIVYEDELEKILSSEDDVDPNSYSYRNKRVIELRLYKFGILKELENSNFNMIRIFREQ